MTERQNYTGHPSISFPCHRRRGNFRDCRNFASDPTFGPNYCQHRSGGFIGLCTLPEVELIVYNIGDDTLTYKPGA